jgi:hypothetical protein
LNAFWKGTKVLNQNSPLADGSYDSNENFKYLQEKKIRSEIKVSKNPIITPKNNKMRNGEVKNQTRDLLKSKKKRLWKAMDG